MVSIPSKQVTPNLCQCGCGNPTKFYRGRLHKPNKYIKGHSPAPINKPRPIAERFWEKVKKGDPDECWLWQAGTYPKGYGSFTLSRDEGHRNAHRIAYILTHGSIPDNLVVMHKCDNPPCCNPNHLELGTNADNSADMARKGRAISGFNIHPESRPRGVDHWRSKLTDEKVVQMRSMYVRNVFGYRSVAKLFDVNEQTVRHIILRHTWTHVP